MEFLSNEGINALGDKLRASLSEGDRLSIISSYFTVFAYGELKDELSRIEELRFLFDEPTFVQQMADLKEPKEFVLSKRGRERGIGGHGLELTLRNNLNQRALAHECAEWVRSKAAFKSARQRGVVQSGSVYHVAHADGKLMALLSRLRDSQSEINVLRSRYRDKEATLAESSRLRMELRKAERARDGIADEIKELCRG